jgi:hypothetical protein
MTTGTIIYFVIAYIIMYVASSFMVFTMHEPSISTKLVGLCLFLFAPITLPLLILTIIAINVL